MICEHIFKAYDIRGIVDQELTEESVYLIGKAFGSKTKNRVVVGYDGRLSGPRLANVLIQGLRESGCDVLCIGCVPTPVVYFATSYFNTGTGIMITGSHNPPAYNGLKMMMDGTTLFGEHIQELYKNIQNHHFSNTSKIGTLENHDIKEAYFEAITSNIHLRKHVSIAIDCGNGIPGDWAPELFERLGCHVDRLFCEVDGNFPNHHPDPAKPENLSDLILHIKNHQDIELGLAFDGDGDRLGIVTKEGEIIHPDRQMMLFSQDILEKNPQSTIVYDVKCTRQLAPWIEKHQGNPLMCRTGHSFIKTTMRDVGAIFGGEMSGHLFFKDRWFGFDDGLYAGARLLELASMLDDPSSIFDCIPSSHNTPEINIPISLPNTPHTIIEQLKNLLAFPDALDIIRIDGLRIEFSDGFALIRASNTTPVLVLRFEGDTFESLDRIKNDFFVKLESTGIIF
jgi:phosphomannomutase/phosphoglucomutase